MILLLYVSAEGRSPKAKHMKNFLLKVKKDVDKVYKMC